MLRQQRGREGRELGGLALLLFNFNPFVHWVLVSPVVEVLVPMESGRFPHLIPAASPAAWHGTDLRLLVGTWSERRPAWWNVLCSG